MTDTLVAEPGPAPNASRLRATVLAFPGQRFAVVDGGHFDDVTVQFKRVRLFARSLFLDHADHAMELAGPWLLGLDQSPDALDKVFAIVGDKPAAVFWCCAGGEAVLHRHLRTLNMARIPAWAADGSSVPAEDGTGQELRTVMFRHWDPRVLGALMPVLEAGQFARVLGSAEEIAFWAEDFGGLKRVIADAEWPQARSGMLTISSSQIVAMSERRLHSMRCRIKSYIIDCAPETIRDLPNEYLEKKLDQYYAEGERLGLREEQAYKRWAYMNIMSDGQISRTKEARHYIQHGPGAPDDRVSALMEEIIEGLGLLAKGHQR